MSNTAPRTDAATSGLPPGEEAPLERLAQEAPTGSCSLRAMAATPEPHDRASASVPRMGAWLPDVCVAELPERFASPFDPAGPHPLARRAAEALQDALRRGELAGGLGFDTPSGGKMFGVLVVAGPDGRVGYLRGFSGMLGGAWNLEGFVPPLFDEAALSRIWPAFDGEIAELNRKHQALETGPEVTALRGQLAALVGLREANLAAMTARHTERRQRRHEERRLAQELPEPERAPALHELDQRSRADKAERRKALAAGEQERAALAKRLAEIDAERAALEQFRTGRSHQLWQEVNDTYVFTNARGEQRRLRQLFAQAPPGGAGDCAAPKLLHHAYRLGLRPVALAEFWWGAPPLTGGRHSGLFYPPCRGKCGPVLDFMLQGLPADPAPALFGAAQIPDGEPRTVFEDAWLVVVEKPCGLLSVPGGSAGLRDSVLTRLRQRYPDATGPMLVHRLDLDTSGLLLAARNMETYVALQRQFARRQIEKRYVAWLDGEVAQERGRVELALRVDLDDRPRQIHDPEHGLEALTEWRVLERKAGRTRVALVPHTGRTHQLRVHAAHEKGIGVPIVGDRLYGRGGGERLMLHAEAIAFVHPHTGARVELESPAPF